MSRDRCWVASECPLFPWDCSMSAQQAAESQLKHRCEVRGAIWDFCRCHPISRIFIGQAFTRAKVVASRTSLRGALAAPSRRNLLPTLQKGANLTNFNGRKSFGRRRRIWVHHTATFHDRGATETEFVTRNVPAARFAAHGADPATSSGGRGRRPRKA